MPKQSDTDLSSHLPENDPQTQHICWQIFSHHSGDSPKRNGTMKRFTHTALAAALSLAALNAAFAADPVAGTTTSTTTSSTGTVTTTSQPPLTQGIKSVSKNLERDPDNKGLQNAQQRLLDNQTRQELQRTEREHRVETAKLERVERVERAERVERPERPSRVERPEGGRGR